jgi:hypothetical protein
MASLAEALYMLPAERLRTLVQLRKVDAKKLALIPDKRQLVQSLASELSKPPSVAAAILHCNARELRLLQILASEERNQIRPWERVLDIAGGKALAHALIPVIARLEEMGLAFRLSNGLFVPESVALHIPTSLSDRHTVVRLLNVYDAPTLKRICDRLGLDPGEGTNAAIIEAIRHFLLDVDPAVRKSVRLDEEQVDVLEYLIQSGGAAAAIEVAGSVLEGRADDFFRYDWQNRWKRGQERNAIDRLLACGLLYVVPQGYGYNLFLVIPGDLLRILTGDADNSFWTDRAPEAMPLPAPPAAATSHAGTIRDVVALMGFLGAQEAVRTSTGHIHKTSLKNLARTLTLPNERYAAFLYALCRDAALIAPQGDKQVYALTEKGASWMHWETVAQVSTLFKAWHNGTTWGEMYGDPLKKASDYRRTDLMLAMRHAVLGLLKERPGETFVDLSSVTDALTFRCPLLLAQSATMGPDLVPSPATFVRLLIGECLTWLGLAELGWKEVPLVLMGSQEATAKARKGRPSAARITERGEPTEKAPPPEATGFRLTPLGAYLFGFEGVEAPAEAPREDRFIVQANAEIFVPPYLAPATFYQLLMLTEMPARGTTGNTVCLTRESIRRALDQGETPREILAFLQGHSRTGIPQNVEYLINEVGAKHGHIHIGRAQMYLNVDLPLLLKELQAHRELKGYFVRSLSDTVALLRVDDPEKLLRDLRKAGYLPISDDAPRARKLGARPQEAPPPTELAPPQENPKTTRDARADTALDWQRIAREDGKPWRPDGADPSPASMPTDAHRNKMAIKYVLDQAAREKLCVEIAYAGQDGLLPRRRVIEPERIVGNFVNAYCRSNESDEMFNINRIQWARLTGEAFLI